MDDALCRGLYAVLILFQSLVEAKLFRSERFFFRQLLQFLPLATIKT